jgi:hypothetical protein
MMRRRGNCYPIHRRTKVPKSDTKLQQPQPVVTVSITPGPVTPAQKTAWRKFWLKLRAQVEQNAPAVSPLDSRLEDKLR